MRACRRFSKVLPKEARAGKHSSRVRMMTAATADVRLRLFSDAGSGVPAIIHKPLLPSLYCKVLNVFINIDRAHAISRMEQTGELSRGMERRRY